MTTTPVRPARYQYHPRARCLRALAFARHADIPAALADPGFSCPPPAETAMMLFNGTSVFALNLVSGFVWDWLGTTADLEEIVGAVVAVFGTDAETARVDVARLCEALIEQGLVIRKPE